MNYKLEYITKLFQRMSNKALETYVLTRLWHRLNDVEIKIAPQQYVNRHEDKYALTDVYFPQVKLHVEVNERAHYESEERIHADGVRKSDIESRTGHAVYAIDCRKSLSEIHQDVDEIVAVIEQKIVDQKKAGVFEPWNPDLERDPLYWKSQKQISVKDEVSMSNIEDICTLFDADFKKTRRGFLRRGGLTHPSDPKVLLWWPSEVTRQGWQNQLVENEQTIIETHLDPIKKQLHFEEHFNTDQRRVVFFHYKDILGLTSYKFKGVFAFDTSRSNLDIGIVWKKIGDHVTLA